MEQVTSTLINFAKQAVGALVILIIGWIVVNAVCNVIAKLLEKSKLDKTVVTFLNKLIKIVLRVLLVMMILSKLGVDMTSVIALFTSGALAVGLALQGCLANFAGGLLLLITKPFKVGDYISDGTNEGTVKAISMIYTYLTTGDNHEITIPNGALANTTIRNITANGTRRCDYTVNLAYTQNFDEAEKVLLEVANANAYALKDPAPCVLINKFGASGAEAAVRIWVKCEDYWPATNTLLEDVKHAFDDKKLVYPYEAMNVNVIDNK
ncbi:MAG: mechanosensitive ion channel [Lachnospiraceae bacterium]|nr:mechanosensitive ion channel [Lachnospiraceae bacterium]